MSAEIRKLVPDGDTPTAEALRAAYQTLKDSGKTRGTLVLVSDGESTCEDPCEAAKEISADGFEIDAITVGFQISDGGREQLECISQALDGRYLDVRRPRNCATRWTGSGARGWRSSSRRPATRRSPAATTRTSRRRSRTTARSRRAT